MHVGADVETAHILFLDVVAFGTRRAEQQKKILSALRDLVSSTAEFRTADRRGELVRLDRGDGMALVFTRSALGPLRCSIELADALANEEFAVRIGLHSGPVGRYLDINDQPGFYGNAIVDAQRVMSFGEGGHILLSRTAAEIARDFDAYRPHIVKVGVLRDKHDDGIEVYCFHNGTVGRRWTHAPQGPTSESRHRTRDEAGGLEIEHAGGAMHPYSPFYVVREADGELMNAVAAGEPTVLVKGARQMGKTSLLARVLRDARHRHIRVAFTDFQALSGAEMASADRFYLALAFSLAEQLQVDCDPASAWVAMRSGGSNLEKYLRRQVIVAADSRLVWVLDEADSLFGSKLGSEVFGLFRSWHNGRATEPDSPLRNLTLVMSYATEPHLFIKDLNQSPFNVGVQIELRDFNVEEVKWLNERYGAPVKSDDDMERLGRLVGGHPFLTRRALEEMALHGATMEDLERAGRTDDGPFADHLRRLLALLHEAEDVREAICALLRGAPCPNIDAFFRLRSAGIISGNAHETAVIRCGLYETFLRRHLRDG